MFDNFYLEPTDILLEKAKSNAKYGFDINELKNDIKDDKISGSGIKNKLTKLIAHSPESLASDVPTIMDIIFYTITVGVPLAINPILAIPLILANKIIRDAADAKIIGKYISDYNLQINRVQKKIDSEENPDKKKFWKDYKDKLVDGRAALIVKKEDLRDLSINGDSETQKIISDSVDIFEKEYYLLTSEQRAYFYDESLFLDEGVKQEIKSVSKSIKDKQDQMDKWFNDTLKGIRNKSRDKVRDDIVEDSYPKLSKMIKRAIVIGAAWAINPALAGIAILVQAATSKIGTEKERKRLLAELNKELEIIEEKIKDADSNSDREKKYELMRMKHNIQTNIDKIKRFI